MKNSIDIKKTKSNPDRSFIKKYWPYPAFIAFVFIYSLLFLADGYNATDEGYLQSMAQRIVDGEQLYVDFYFFRPPLSLYIQAALIKIFDDSYTILSGRWFWTLQMVILVLLLSSIYRKFVKPYELLLLLCASWILTSLLIAFPWYSYDALFFAVVSIFLYYKRQFLLAGIAMFLAALAKQNYLLLLPCLLVAFSLLQMKWREVKIINLMTALKLLAGFIIPSLLFLTYIHLSGGGLKAFVWNLYTMPRETSGVNLTFALFQNNLEAMLKSIPMIAAVILWSLNNKNKIILLLASLATITAIVLALDNTRSFVYELIYFNYTLLIIIIIRALFGILPDNQKLWHHFLPLIAFGFVIQYLAGFNYAGLIFSYMGAAPAFIAGWILFRKSDLSKFRQYVSLGFMVVLIGLGLFYKYDFVARDDKRHRLDTIFTTPKLAGIYSTERNVKQIESLIDAINEHTSERNYIFAFSDFPSIYYLTNRKNPTKIGWYVMKEYTMGMLAEALKNLDRKQPSLVILQQYSENDFLRERDPLEYWRYRRYAPMYNWITKRNQYIGLAGDIQLFVPLQKGYK